MTDDTIALPPLPDRITETGARRIFLTEQEAMDYAREAVRLYIAGRVGAEPDFREALQLICDAYDFFGPSHIACVGAIQGAKARLAAAPTTPPDAQGDER